MNDQELKIKEFRTIEAKKKNYMGMQGKFGYILAALGQPILAQMSGGGMFTQTYMANYDEEPKDPSDFKPGTPEEIMKQIPSADEVGHNPPDGWEWHCDWDADIYDEQLVGYNFNGLSRGMHLEITYKKSDKNLLVYYKGYQVFKEHAGDLRAYAPSEKWESLIDRLYKSAVKILKERANLKLVQAKKKSQAKKENWLVKLQERWGFNLNKDT